MKLTTPAGPFRFDASNNPIHPRYIIRIREVNGAVQPVVLATIPEFVPETAPPPLPPNLVLPRK